jgi:hypothetical protein
MILARADRELRALVGQLRDDAAVAKRLGMELDGLIEAAEERTPAAGSRRCPSDCSVRGGGLDTLEFRGGGTCTNVEVGC